MAKTLRLYSVLTETRNLKLYDEDIRALFNLPVRKGKITSVVYKDENRIEITFEKIRCVQQSKKII